MSEPLVTAALDLAKVSGVCWGEPFSTPFFETWVLGGADTPRGQRGKNLMAKLVEFIARVRPEKIYIEAPLTARVLAEIGSNSDTTIALQGFVMIAETVAFTRGVPTELLERKAVLQHFTGQPSFSRRDKNGAKKACLARCGQLRWPVAGYDEADAGALWHYGCARDNPRAFALAGVGEAVRTHRRRIT